MATQTKETDMAKRWYTIRAAANGGAELVIYDEIGIWGITARDFFHDLKALGDVGAITVRIHCPGGSVTEGLAIYNLLRSHPAHVTVKIDGIAASIASVIAMAGDVVEMPSNTFMMIHDPVGQMRGTEEDMREIADILKAMKAALVKAYVTKTGKTEEEVAAIMAAETLLTAQEAKDGGFADVITDEVKIAACAFPDALTNLSLPEHVATAFARPTAATTTDEEESHMSGKTKPAADENTPASTTEAVAAETARAEGISRVCNDAGCPQLISNLLSTGATVADAEAKVAGIAGLRDICASAKKLRPDWDIDTMQAEFIAKGVPADVASKALLKKMADEDGATEIVDRLAPEQMTGAADGAQASAGWAAAINKVQPTGV